MVPCIIDKTDGVAYLYFKKTEMFIAITLQSFHNFA